MQGLPSELIRMLFCWAEYIYLLSFHEKNDKRTDCFEISMYYIGTLQKQHSVRELLDLTILNIKRNDDRIPSKA